MPWILRFDWRASQKGLLQIEEWSISHLKLQRATCEESLSAFISHVKLSMKIQVKMLRIHPDSLLWFFCEKPQVFARWSELAGHLALSPSPLPVAISRIPVWPRLSSFTVFSDACQHLKYHVLIICPLSQCSTFWPPGCGRSGSSRSSRTPGTGNRAAGGEPAS